MIPADRLRARLPGFRDKVQRALLVIAEANEKGAVAVSFSGGKDSLVVWGLLRESGVKYRSVFFDSGAELTQTYAMISSYGTEIVYPEFSMIELLKYGGYWGYKYPVDGQAEFDFKQILIEEPAARFGEENNIAVHALGLRRDESKGRRMNAILRGELYQVEDGSWRLCPVAFWSADDIWAYIADRKLDYNEAYDLMNQAGISRDAQRIGAFFGTASARLGRFAYLKAIDPSLFNRMAADFPGIRVYA